MEEGTGMWLDVRGWTCTSEHGGITVTHAYQWPTYGSSTTGATQGTPGSDWGGAGAGRAATDTRGVAELSLAASGLSLAVRLA